MPALQQVGLVHGAEWPGGRSGFSGHGGCFGLGVTNDVVVDTSVSLGHSITPNTHPGMFSPSLESLVDRSAPPDLAGRSSPPPVLVLVQVLEPPSKQVPKLADKRPDPWLRSSVSLGSFKGAAAKSSACPGTGA